MLLARILSLSLAVTAMLATSVGAQDRPAFEDLLAAGEFGPAAAAAQGQNDPATRDQMLAQLAAAQAQSGARPAAFATSYGIGSDQVRGDVVRGFRDMPFGGGPEADFTQLIQLIQSTIAPTSWAEVGGPGSIEEFRSGVTVDTSGLLSRLAVQDDASLVALRRQATAVQLTSHSAAASALPKTDPRRTSPLRKISLRRLEQEVQLRAAEGLPPDDAQQCLAGLTRMQYVFFYPEEKDIVLAGPAGEWRPDAEGRLVNVANGLPVMHLDDLVVVLRNAFDGEGKFGCSITPTQDGLKAAKEVGEKWSAAPLKPGQKDRWLGEMRDALGKQDITVDGIDPRTRTALAIVEADYRMKCVGMGLEKGVLGVQSYFDHIDPAHPPKFDVLRWWFTLNYQHLTSTPERDAFELIGPGARILSENERLNDQGERIHTGQSNAPTQQFADDFTKHFAAISAKYPVYGELRNIFDLAVVAALIKQQDIAELYGWQMTHFGPKGDYQPWLGQAPKQVETIVNSRTLSDRGRTIVAGVSGGVSCDPRSLVEPSAIQKDDYGLMAGERRHRQPGTLPRGVWWWD